MNENHVCVAAAGQDGGASHAVDFPAFRPHPWIRGPHRQTLYGYFFQGTTELAPPHPYPVSLDDGDSFVLHENRSPRWRCGGPVALLMHGLAGCHQSGYLVRMTEKLLAHGWCVFRMDHRGSGAAVNSARLPYHAGLGSDVVAACTAIATICPGSPLSAVGFSLSGNILLKALAAADWRGHPPRSAIAINPPIDLGVGSRALSRAENRLYERQFVRILSEQVARRIRTNDDAPRPAWRRPPKSLREFDDGYTAFVWGFNGVDDYYTQSSARGGLRQVTVPTLILTSRDDPLVPVSMFADVPDAGPIQLHVAPAGGHLGYISRRTNDPDRRWMDWRIVEWLKRHVPSA